MEESSLKLDFCFEERNSAKPVGKMALSKRLNESLLGPAAEEGALSFSYLTYHMMII